ncbi:sigma-70 family RNA polymerase sigma factor [Mumia zhuanghuii]|uniref:ECF RNA polymerase sigma factor SigK n=2 Tax=Mumia TaxID=1546255 RepID=A0ABW1QM04_9ACTN|nr:MULTISPECIES: ECF RNA polymerase sigma factor SigK [Mumia]KAA1423701.1 sigma-70 family RNA polymerase sigma factor [Mumia zhuanghuii]
MPGPERGRRAENDEGDPPYEDPLEPLMARVARGDEQAFGAVYDALAGSVFGLVRRVVRDPVRAEEVTQEVFLQVWQKAPRFDASRGRPKTWVLTLAHRRAVDVVRHDQAASDRDQRYDWTGGPAYDQVADEVTVRLEHQAVRRCLETLTELQREAVGLAYYQGHTYAETASILDANPATVKTRLRDGLIRLRDCLGVTA